MKNCKAAGLIALILCFHTLGAQNFATRQLEYLSGLLKYPLPQENATFHCQKVGALPLIIEYDTAGAVSHLGVAVFSQFTKESVGKIVCDFQERLFLELLLQSSETKVRKLLEEYKVLWRDERMDSKKFFKSLENSLFFAWNKANNYVLTKDSLTWTSSWNDDTRVFSLRFPSNYDLILGMDKKEMEIWLAAQLQNFHCQSPAYSPLQVESDELEQLSGSVFVKRGKKLFRNSINSNLYFERKTDSAFYLLYDRELPAVSIVNLFNHLDQRAEELNLQIRQPAYGGKSYLYKMKLSDFQCFMGGDYEIFTGIEKSTPDTLVFTVFYKSLWYNCSHSLHVKTTPQHLFDKMAPLVATFSTFSPNQNIQNLYKGENIKDTIQIPLILAHEIETKEQFELICDKESKNLSSDVNISISKTKENEYKTKRNNSCIIIGNVLSVGGFAGMMCTLNTDKLWVSTGVMFIGAVNVLIGNLILDSGNRKAKSTNNYHVNKNKTTTTLNVGLTQSGVGLTLKF